MPRKSLDIRPSQHPFPRFRHGRVWAEPGKWVKGLVPCGFSGRSPGMSPFMAPVIISSIASNVDANSYRRSWICVSTSSSISWAVYVLQSLEGMYLMVFTYPEPQDILDPFLHVLHIFTVVLLQDRLCYCDSPGVSFRFSCHKCRTHNPFIPFVLEYRTLFYILQSTTFLPDIPFLTTRMPHTIFSVPNPLRSNVLFSLSLQPAKCYNHDKTY